MIYKKEELSCKIRFKINVNQEHRSRNNFILMTAKYNNSNKLVRYIIGYKWHSSNTDCFALPFFNELVELEVHENSNYVYKIEKNIKHPHKNKIVNDLGEVFYSEPQSMEYEINSKEDIIRGLVVKAQNENISLKYNIVLNESFVTYYTFINMEFDISDLLQYLQISIKTLEKFYQFENNEDYKEKIIIKEFENYDNYLYFKFESMVEKRWNYVEIYGDDRLIFSAEVPIKKNMEIYNVCVESYKKITFCSQIDGKLTLKTTKKRYYSLHQLGLYLKKNKKTDKDISYFSNRIIKPKKLVILCPFMQQIYTKTPYTLFSYSSMRQEFKKHKVKTISFIDDFSQIGTYLLVDDKGKFIFDKYVKKVYQLLEKYSLTQNDLMFVGFSKGGTIALNFKKHFKNAHAVAITPQLNLNIYFLTHTYLFNAFRNVKVSQVINYIYNYQFDENTNIIMSSNDMTSTAGLLFGNIKWSDESHFKVSENERDCINTLIKNFLGEK